MFKKPFALPASNKCSGVERKRLRKSFHQHYPRLSEEDLSEVIPQKERELEVFKLKGACRCNIYLMDAIPMILDTSSKGDLIPSLFCLWKLPHTLPVILLKNSEVSKFILNGADLMLPGAMLTKEGDSFLNGTYVSLCVPNNPMPFAIGQALMSTKQAIDNFFEGGKLVRVIHHYGDFLFKKLKYFDIPQGFTETFIFSLESPECAPQIQIHNIQNWEEIETKEETEVASAEKITTGTEKELNISEEEGSDNDLEVIDKVKEKSLEEMKEEMDGLLEMCLLQSLRKSVKDEDLPLPAGRLWTHHMHPNQYPDSETDVKKSSYKKLSKFLQAYGAKGGRIEGLLDLTEDKYSKETVINKVNRENPAYLNFRTYKVHVEDPSQTKSSIEPVNGLQVEHKFKPGKELFPILNALSLPYDSLFSLKEIGELGFSYVKTANLDQGYPDKTCIVLDKTLSEALFKGKVKKNEKYPTCLKKADLRDCMLEKMTRQNWIARGTEQLVVKGRLHPIKIVQEKKMNRLITCISGMESFLIDPEDLVFVCKKTFSCAATASPAPGRGRKDQEIMVQGHVGQRMQTLLEIEYHVPIQYITLKK